ADSYSLANFQKGMHRPGKPLGHEGTDCFDLFVGNRNALSPHAHNSEHTANSARSQALFVSGQQLHEDVATEQWQFHSLAPVAPAMNFADQGKERGHALFAKSLCNGLLVASTSLQRIPITVGFGDWHWRRDWPHFAAAAHSFAL